MDMTRRTLAATLGAAGPALAQAPPRPPAWTVPDDAAIRRILVERIDVQKAGVGIVVGVIDPHGRRVIAYGAKTLGETGSPDANTVFEIGSITKVFTSLLLADMARKGEVSIDDPVARYLPPDARVPERNGAKITLQDLATHTSGLPSLPTNFAPKDPGNPYADYTPAQLYQFLGGYTLTRDIGATYAYSNMGAGLLGQALSRRAGMDYETLVKRRITGPLGMADTAIKLTPAMRARLAHGYDAGLGAAQNWDLPTFAGAGALRSTAQDMMTFLAAELGLKPTPLKPAMDYQLSAIRRPAGGNMSVALGWHILKTPKAEIVWHNGGTGGYRTFIGFDPAARVGVVVLTNAATQRGGDDIGFHLLAGAPLTPAPKAPAARTEVTLTPAQREALVGRYRFAPGAEIAVTTEAGKLYGQLTGQPRFELHAESPTKVYWTVVEAQGDFELGPDGRAAKFTLHQNGRDLPAPRLP